MALVDLKDVEHEVPRMFRLPRMNAGLAAKLFVVPESHLFIIDTIWVSNGYASGYNLSIKMFIPREQNGLMTGGSDSSNTNWMNPYYDATVGGQWNNSGVDHTILWNHPIAAYAAENVLEGGTLYLTEGDELRFYCDTQDKLDVTICVKDCY